MKVVLLKNVPGIGKVGDSTEVADGYARNYLIPRKLAVPATPKTLRSAAEQKSADAARVFTDLRTAQMNLLKLKSTVLEFREKAASSGKLYAAVSSQKIAEALQGIGVAADSVVIGAPFKEAGDFRAQVSLGFGISSEVLCRVIAEVSQ